MIQTLAQAVIALAGLGAASALAATGTISGSDALAVISAVVGYAIHASGVTLGTPPPTPLQPMGTIDKAAVLAAYKVPPAPPAPPAV
jgi:hypothetical protein